MGWRTVEFMSRKSGKRWVEGVIPEVWGPQGSGNSESWTGGRAGDDEKHKLLKLLGRGFRPMLQPNPSVMLI